MTDASESTIRDQLDRALEDEDLTEEHPASFPSAEAEAAYWRTRFEQERERLAKLWVAYQDVEAELAMRERETETIAQRKAAAQLAQAESTRADEEPDDRPGVLAVAPPDDFEVVCEAEERDVVVGRGTSFPLVFVNRGEDAIEVSLTVEDSPEGWSALTTETGIELDPKSSRTVYALVRPPAEARAGQEAAVTVAVETSEGPTERLRLVAEVVESTDDEEPGLPDRGEDEAVTADGGEATETSTG